MEDKELEDFFNNSIKKAESNAKGRTEASAYLSTFTDSLSATLSGYANADINVRCVDEFDYASRLRRLFQDSQPLSLTPPKVQEKMGAKDFTIAVESRRPYKIGSYIPDVVGYFPVTVAYGTKEISCDNMDEIKSALKTMVDDSMMQILEFIQGK